MSTYSLTYCPIETPEDIPTMGFESMDDLTDYVYENSSDQTVFVYWELAIEFGNQHNPHRKFSISCDLEDVVDYFNSLEFIDFNFNVFEFETYKDALAYCGDMWEGVTRYYDTESMVQDLATQIKKEGPKPSQA